MMSGAGDDLTGCSAGEKRKVESTLVDTVDDVCSWLEAQIDSGGCGNVAAESKAHIISCMRESGVDREVLSTLSENDLKDLGVFLLPLVPPPLLLFQDLMPSCTRQASSCWGSGEK